MSFVAKAGESILWGVAIIPILRWLSKIMLNKAKKILVKTQQDVINYIHYRNRAMKKDHGGKQNNCHDGLCGTVHIAKNPS